MSDGPVVALVPAFHPEPAVVDLVAALGRQTDRVMVVADGPGSVPADLREALEAAGATLLDHAENRGIAAALNTGVRAVSEALAILTVDQDSTVPEGYVDALRGAWRRAVESGIRVGLVAPEHVSGLSSQRSGRVPVQSGLLIPAATFGTVGEFDERLFIDGVDADFALRVLDAGLDVVIADGVELGHRLGASYTVRVAGGRLELTRSQPFRYYYLTRNRLWLMARHGRRHPGWAAGQAVGLARHLVLVQAFVPGRRARAAAVGRGIRDGLGS